MKEITKYWKQTCIDFGRYVQQQWARHEDVDTLWIEYQSKMAKDIMDVLDDVTPNDKINCYCGHTTICDCQPLNAIEKAENDFIKSKIEEAEEEGFDDDYKSEMKEDFIKSADSEIAVIDKDGEMLYIAENDQVIGWLSPDKVAKVIAIVSSSTTKNEIETKIKSLNI